MGEARSAVGQVVEHVRGVTRGVNRAVVSDADDRLAVDDGDGAGTRRPGGGASTADGWFDPSSSPSLPAALTLVALTDVDDLGTSGLEPRVRRSWTGGPVVLLPDGPRSWGSAVLQGLADSLGETVYHPQAPVLLTAGLLLSERDFVGHLPGGGQPVLVGRRLPELPGDRVRTAPVSSVAVPRAVVVLPEVGVLRPLHVVPPAAPSDLEDAADAEDAGGSPSASGHGGPVGPADVHDASRGSRDGAGPAGARPRRWSWRRRRGDRTSSWGPAAPATASAVDDDPETGAGTGALPAAPVRPEASGARGASVAAPASTRAVARWQAAAPRAAAIPQGAADAQAAGRPAQRHHGASSEAGSAIAAPPPAPGVVPTPPPASTPGSVLAPAEALSTTVSGKAGSPTADVAPPVPPVAKTVPAPHEPARRADLHATPAGTTSASASAAVEPSDDAVARPWVAVADPLEDDARQVRDLLGWQYGVAQRRVTDVMAVNPGLRRALASRSEAVGQLVALQACLAGRLPRVNAVLRGHRAPDAGVLALARSASAGCRWLPAATGPVLTARPRPRTGLEAFPVGSELLEPGLLTATRSPVLPLPPGLGEEETILFLLHGRTGRQVQVFAHDCGPDVLFAAGTRWRVLDRSQERAGGVVHLQEVSPADVSRSSDAGTPRTSERAAGRAATALAAVRLERRHPDGDHADPGLLVCPGLHRDGSPVDPQASAGVAG